MLEGAERLAAAGCDTPRLDAELLVAHVLHIDRGALLARPETALTGRAARRAVELLARRAEREPVAYLVGVRGFRRLELHVDRRVLIPRPETEMLVEVALELGSGARVHEVGTGSGAVALALRDERPDLRVSASDVSPEALAVARENAERLGIDVPLVEAAGVPPEGRDADLVVANLPYVRESEWPSLAAEITRYEPRGALVSGTTGLEAIGALVAGSPPGTRMALEHGADQGEAVRTLLEGARTWPDLAALERVTVGRVPGEGRADF